MHIKIDQIKTLNEKLKNFSTLKSEGIDKKEGFNRWMEMFTSRKYTFYQILNEEQKKAFRENMNKIYDNSPPVMQRFLDSYMGDSEKIMKKAQ